ncbi:hemagglutinin repeat-containing protein, partial [Snodgrassella sp. ESL0253]|uniref:hemagglutinin repeat-containing protein n=1 Tax=Snodgrassella sp. ESL0253 TaxID=2705031 RepID=UPI00158220C0|nr:hypothetical protein [Snodgrassella sp. ESL0253]
MQAGEAASSAYQAASTPIVATLNHQRSHQTQDTHTSQSVTTQASAGGNLNIIATDGSINSEGARLTAEGNALLHAKDNINLSFARDSHNQSATSKSSGFNLDTRKWSSPIGA